MNRELAHLMERYALPKSGADRLIKSKLQHIAELFEECDPREMVFANEICVEFCRLFQLLEQKYTQNEEPRPEQQAFMERICSKYKTGEDLLNVFYNYYKENKHIDYCRIEGYPFKDALDRKEKISATMKDYTSRIKTFARRYLPELVEQGRLLPYGADDPILFVYANLTKILEKFDVTEQGSPNKQRQNIRSALRKLYDFRCVDFPEKEFV